MKTSESLKEKVNEILVSNGLDFNITKVPLVALLADKTIKTDYFGLLNEKNGKIIHTVKDGYTVSQNKEIVEMILMGMENFGELSVYNAGAINDGRKIFIQLAIEGYSKVGNDLIKKYITVIDSNDGSTGLSVGIGNLTMSCQNQFWKFYKSGQMKAKHTATIQEKIKTLPILIKSALSENFKMIEIFNKFQSTPVTKKLANDMVKTLIGFDRIMIESKEKEVSTRSKNIMNSLYKAIDIEMSSKGENLWGLFSGVTRWTSHDNSVPKRENGRIESGMLGNNYRFNQKALEFAIELV